MRQGIQTFFTEAGESACYALCLIDLAVDGLSENEVGVPIQMIYNAMKRGFIHYDWNNPEDPDNFFVSDPAGFLYMMTGKKWNVRKEGPDYHPKPLEKVIERWERGVTGKITGHFRRQNFDPLLSSQTVKYGKIASLRVFSVIE